MRTVLFVGAGRHQRRAIQRARELGLRVVGVDRNADALGLQEADVAETVDFQDVEGVIAAAERHRVDGVLTISADRAVPVVAAVAEALGLPGIGTATAERMTHKALMRRAFADAGVPQPPWAAVETLDAARDALGDVGCPPCSSPRTPAASAASSCWSPPRTSSASGTRPSAESATGVAILERFRPGMEMNGLVIARDGRAEPLTLSDRRRPPGVGFGVGWMHVYPPTIPVEQHPEAERIAARAVEALGLRHGIGFPQLIATDEGTIELVECAARIPGGQMADLARHATGVDLVEVQLRFALGDPIPDGSSCPPRVRQPLAIRFFTAQPGPLPTGRVVRLGSLEPVLAAPGVVQADSYIVEGETIRPVRLDGDRRGYVIATGDTNLEALERAEAAARLYRPEVA